MIRHGDREIGSPHAAPRPAEHLERMEGAVVDEMTIDVQERAVSRARLDDVPRPNLLEERPPGHQAFIVRRQ
jgi:hypothetical protein